MGIYTAPDSAYAFTGHARAVQAAVGGAPTPVTTALADTGPLVGPHDARDASLLEWTIPSLLTGDALHATTIGGAGQVESEAALRYQERQTAARKECMVAVAGPARWRIRC